MSDLTDLSSLAGDALTETQIQGLLAQIDLDIANLVREGKLAALKSSVAGPAGQSADRAANLKALLVARAHYQKLLERLPSWETSEAGD